jgi:hypothetical protein
MHSKIATVFSVLLVPRYYKQDQLEVPGGYKYGVLTLKVRRVSNLRQYNMVRSPAGLGPKNYCAGEDQHQL